MYIIKQDNTIICHIVTKDHRRAVQGFREEIQDLLPKYRLNSPRVILEPNRAIIVNKNNKHLTTLVLEEIIRP